ncbi:endothelin-converting enzyme 1 [Rhipicephalus sanguineus]|uniref:endothelin-converting enzyme 1 n=1 Tax=Rhipicephalus sanguineus TaxID=34632 RepID=UPI0020C1DACB|nr:endothelin-converting enzyme 1 [Rhipicephalus sanguineus]
MRVQVPVPETSITQGSPAGKQPSPRHSYSKADARRRRSKSARSATASGSELASPIIDPARVPQEPESGACISPDDQCAKGGASPQASPPSFSAEENDQQRQQPSVPFPQAKSSDVPADARASSPAANSAQLLSRPDEVRSRNPEAVISKTTLQVPRKYDVVTIILITVAVGTLFFVTVFLVASKHAARRLRLCHTEDCGSHAALLSRAFDTQLDPCDDFEAFVCSAWHASETRREQAMSVMDDLRFTWYDHFEDTLTRGTKKFQAGRKPLAVYHMCRNNFPTNASQVSLILDFLAHHGLSWPEPPEKPRPPLALLVTLSYKWESPYWITVRLLEPSASGNRRVQVTPGLYLPILRNNYYAITAAYYRYWQMFLELIYPDPDKRPAINTTVVNDIRALEEDVLDSLHTAAESPRKRPATFPFSEIGTHVPNTSAVEWAEAFQAGMSLQPNLTVDDEIVATDVAFLGAVSRLLSKYGPLKLNQHLTWLIMQNCPPATDYAFLLGYYGSEEKAAAHASSHCAHKVETLYKVLLLALGLFTRLTDLDRKVIEAGFNSLISAASGSIRNSRWMDDRSKAHAVRKLDSVRNDMWPPVAILDEGALEKIYAAFPEKEPSFADYWIKTLEVIGGMDRTPEYCKALSLPSNNFPDYAGYDYVTNSVRTAIGAVAAPAYYSNGTKGMLYGGLLFLMATQMVKAIDDEGIRWLPDGTGADATILSGRTLQAFRDRSECPHGGNSRTVFPEVPALEVAHAALTASHHADQTEPLALSNQLPEEKVFFMTLCYMSCSKPARRPGFLADCNKARRDSVQYESAAFAYASPTRG